jgi:rare lipoprotein A (peptidoglycan hydrolase)
MPALVLLLAATLFDTQGAARAAEGTDAPPPPPPPTLQAAATPAPMATQAADLQDTVPAVALSVIAVPPRMPPPRPLPAGHGPVWTDSDGTWRQAGIASWYGGRRWQGRPTASGVRFDERQLTAAHASLPLGSVVRVTVADTGRSVVVTINDRPGTRKRVIDLSRAAAEQLGIVERGIARVTLDPA